MKNQSKAVMGHSVCGPVFAHVLEVRYRGKFPTDMLRHDRAWPRTPADATVIDLSRGGTVQVVRHHSHRDPEVAWTFDRWQSFGCECVPVSTADQGESG